MAEWQTRRPQKPLSERACGFESRSGHGVCPVHTHRRPSQMGPWSQVGHNVALTVLLDTATSTIIVWSAVLGGIVALGVILGWVTKTGKQSRRWLRQRLSRRPSVPRTRVGIVPKT